MIFVGPQEKNKSTASCGVAFSGERVRAIILERATNGEVHFKESVSLPASSFVLSQEWAESFGVERALGSIRRLAKRAPIIASYPEEYSFRMLGMAAGVGGDLAEKVHAEILAHAPLAEDDILYDYTPLAQTSAGTSFAAGCISAPHARILSNAFQKNKLPLLALELESEALARVFFSPGEKGAHIILHIEELKSVLVLVYKGVVLSSRSVSFGTEVIRNAMRETFDVSDEEIRFVLESGQLALVPDSELYTIFMAGVELIMAEIKEMMIDYGSYDGSEAVGSVVLSGTGAFLARDFTDYFALGLKLPVRHGDVWKHISLPPNTVPPIPFKQSLEYAVPLGLALAGLPEQTLKKTLK